MKKDIVDKLTAGVIEAMLNPTARKKMRSSQWPSNPVSKSFYNGMNKILLAYIRFKFDFPTNKRITFKQATKLGAKIIKWEKWTPIYYRNFVQKHDEKSDEIKKIPFIKLYYVWNIAQIEWLELDDDKDFDTNPIDDIQSVIDSYLARENIPVQIWEPAYRPSTDTIFMPEIKKFFNADEYYLAFLHEITHSTWSDKRLNRWLNTTFASKDYSKEELVAEFGALLTYSELWQSIEQNTNSFHYLANRANHIKKEWLEQELFSAISKAEKAKKFILWEPTNY